MTTTYTYVLLLTIFNAAILAYAYKLYVADKTEKKEPTLPSGDVPADYYEDIEVAEKRNKLISRTVEEAPANAPVRSDAEVAAEIEESFAILDYLVNKSLKGDLLSLIVAGPAGLGKSFSLEDAISKWDAAGLKHTIASGYVTPASLYKTLYTRRNSGDVLVFDDADSVFGDETSLNLLKAALDTSEKRVISYLSERKMKDDNNGSTIPKSFEFKGTVIFLTNLDFDRMIEKEHKNAVHFKAMLSRAHYIDMGMRTVQDYIVRIKMVIGYGMLKNKGLTQEEENDVINFIETRTSRLRELSLRVAIKIGEIRKGGEKNWAKMAERTTCRRK